MKSPLPLSAAVWAGGRSTADPRLSPDRDAVAFVTAAGSRAELAVRSITGGAEHWLPCEPAVKRVSSTGGGVFDWLPDGGAIAYIGVDGRVHVIDLDGDGCRSITKWPDALSALAVSPDGAQVAYAVDMRDIAVVSTSRGGAWPRRLSSGADFAIDPVWSPDGSWVVWHEWDDPDMPWDSSRIVARRSDGSGPVVTVAGGDNVGVQQPRFSPDGRFLTFLSDAHGWLNLWLVDGATLDDPRPVLAEECEHGAPTWGPGQRTYAWTDDSRHVVVCRNVKGWGELVAYDVERGKAVQIAQGTYSGLSGGRDNVVGASAGPAQASSIEIVDIVRSETAVVARGPLSGIERAGVVPEQVEWANSQGTTVPGRLYRTPVPHSDPPPLLVWIHGGPTGQSPVTLYARFGFFLERGWSVLVPDYRGTTGWGRAHLRALDGQWGVADVDDVASGIRAAVANGWCDPSAVVPYGGSAGGFTALLVMALHPDLCAAGAVAYPVTDLADFGANTWRFEAHYLETLVGPLPAAYGDYVARSPITQAANLRAPLLVLHGDSDVVVPCEQSRRFVDTARRGGAHVEFHVYEGEGHSWRKPETSIDELERVEAFLRRHVLHLSPTTEGQP